MTLKEIKKIVVIGAGTMGAGIAQMCAMTGYQTVLFDVKPEALPKAMKAIEKNLQGAVKRNKITEQHKIDTLNRIHTTTFFADLVGELIIEAIVENINIKLEVFDQVSKINPISTILATNTSSIPITRIAAKLPHPERVVGMHFFNPAHIMKLVEIILGADTNEQVAQTVKELSEKMGKIAVFAKDEPGFIVNRVARHFYVESLKILEENVSDVQGIDKLMRSSGFKMGPFELLDLIGVDVNLSVTKSMFESFQYEAKFRPSRIQQQKVDAKHIGRKTKKGFYTYD